MNPPDPPFFFMSVLHSKSNSNSFNTLTKRTTNATSKNTSQAIKQAYKSLPVFNHKRFTTTTYSVPSL